MKANFEASDLLNLMSKISIANYIDRTEDFAFVAMIQSIKSFLKSIMLSKAIP